VTHPAGFTLLCVSCGKILAIRESAGKPLNAGLLLALPFPALARLVVGLVVVHDAGQVGHLED
jgi:hypothetical protein